MHTGGWLASLTYRLGVSEPTWFVPLLETLDDIAAPTALCRPWPECHCIWELVGHVEFYLRRAMQQLDGIQNDAPTDFPPLPDPPDAAAWDRARASMREAIAALIDQLQSGMNDTRFNAPYMEGGIPRAELIAGVLAHLAYHTGQIRLLAAFERHAK